MPICGLVKFIDGSNKQISEQNLMDIEAMLFTKDANIPIVEKLYSNKGNWVKLVNADDEIILVNLDNVNLIKTMKN